MNYLAIVRNHCSTKTTDLQAEHKYTMKANLCIREQTRELHADEDHGITAVIPW